MGCASSSSKPFLQDSTMSSPPLPALIRPDAGPNMGEYPAVKKPAGRRASVTMMALEQQQGDGVQLSDVQSSELLLQQAMEASDQDAQEKPLIALVSHDNMKPLMASFAKSYADMLKEFRLTGTGTTCKVLRSIGLEPEDRDVPSGPLGGDQVLGGLIAQGEIRALFFFQDPLSSHAHHADIEALARLSNVYQIYYCTNYRTAASVLEQLHYNMTNGNRKSVRVGEGMSSNLGQIVQEKYKQTRQAAVDAAAK